MTYFYECGYPVRIVYMIFLVITMLTLMFLWWLLFKYKCEKKKIVPCSFGLAASFGVYAVLLGDHIVPLAATNWQSQNAKIPIVVLWTVTLAVFTWTSHSIIWTNRQYKNTVTEETIKEAIDEVPLGVCYFRKDGIPMLCNRRMQDISELMSGKIFMSYAELQDMLEQRSAWRESNEIFRFPDGSSCRYAEEELVTADGVQYLVSNFYDVTQLVQRKTELEKQNKELRKMAADLQRLKENIRLLAKEEEVLSIKARWHDVMGEGLTAIRRALLSDQSQEVTDRALQRWSDAVTTIQRDNDDPDQRRDEMGDLLRDAVGLQMEVEINGVMPADKETEQVFILAVRNCLLNAVQHGKATSLSVSITETDRANLLSVTNNGSRPETEIVPRGGLVNVRNHVERIGGKMEIQSTPFYELKVIVPKNRLSQNRERSGLL